MRASSRWTAARRSPAPSGSGWAQSFRQTEPVSVVLPRLGSPSSRGDRPSHSGGRFGTRGRWEDDTLVVETTNFNGKAAYQGSADGLHLVEHDVSVAVALADATLGVDGFAGEEAGPVEIEVGREDPLGESVDPLRVAAGDVAVAEMLSDDRAVLALDQGVVGAASRAGFGERVDVQRLQQRRDFAVDELGAVVGVEAAEDDGNARSRASRTGTRHAASICSTEPMNWNWVTSSTRFRW